MNHKPIPRMLLLGSLCLLLGAAVSPGNPGVPQSPAGRKDVRAPRISRGTAQSLRSRPGTAIRRAAPSFPTWAYAFQGDREDEAQGVFSEADEGIVYWGDTRILGGEGLAWMTKLSSLGQIEWSRVLIGGAGAKFGEITRTSDGGFVGAGSRGGVSTDAIVVKLSASGQAEWGVSFGTEMGDSANSIRQTTDGGYIAAGVTTAYYDAQLTDYWIAKLTASGGIEWSWILGGPGDDGDFMNGAENATVLQSSDGGYFLVGDTPSFGMGGGDICIFKLTSLGGIEWQRTYGGTGIEGFANSGPHAVTTFDGGLVVGCTTSSFNAAGTDGWLFRVSSAGDLVWQKKVGGTQPDSINAIQATLDGGYIIGGTTRALPDDNFRHAWMLKLGPALNIDWQMYYGTGSNFDIQGLSQGSNGSFAAGGCRTPTARSSWYWDVYRDAFVMKVGADGSVGVPGSEFAGLSAATVSDTDAAPQDLAIIPLPGFSTGDPISVSVVDVSPQAELLSWSGLQPPLYLTLSRETNLGLFDGEAINTLQWNPNPWNSRFEIVSYAIYRQSSDGSTPFQKIATVSVNSTAYVDQGLRVNDLYAYVVRSVDSAGNESPISQVARN